MRTSKMVDLMVSDVLAIPITTVASESAFLIGVCVLNKYRNCTFHEKVQAFICTCNWSHGYNIGKFTYKLLFTFFT